MANTDSDKKLQNFQNLQYDVILKKKTDTFVLFIQELALIAEDENIDEAYGKLTIEKDNYFSKMIKNGYEDEIAVPLAKNIDKDYFSKHFAKFMVILLGFLLLIIVGTVGMKKISVFAQSKFWAAKITDVIYYMKHSPENELNDKPIYKNEILRYRTANAAAPQQKIVYAQTLQNKDDIKPLKNIYDNQNILPNRPIDMGTNYSFQ